MTAAPQRTRRDFVRATLIATAGLAARAARDLTSRWYATAMLPPARPSRRRRQSATLTLGLFAGPGSARPDGAARSAVRGAELGVAEATRAATLLGGAVELLPPVETPTAARALVQTGRIAVLVAATDAESAEALAAACDTAQVLFMNVASPADVLRGARCRRFAFHLAASDAMARDAQAEWHRTRGPDAAPPTVEPRVELWHAGLERYGAGQLNDRFRARFEAPLDSTAWAAWLAVKIAWESTRRARTASPAELVRFLERDTTQFDGHKGVPLSFRRWDHQMRQPLYLVAPAGDGSAEQVLFEAPARARAASESTRDALDRLGPAAGATQCRWQ